MLAADLFVEDPGRVMWLSDEDLGLADPVLRETLAAT